ncbi:ribosomal protein s7 [Moniliophthora roreri MCA 2997]|uniref:Ribosomal protein s7 n=1 Tax=Moniliophthora roreri (strain MCA 2997) TaxID=1381753 RepID=V2XK27_MONRO|nr:ribosomal protein s7 [Moniliophthora roreri MCA 2997]
MLATSLKRAAQRTVGCSSRVSSPRLIHSSSSRKDAKLEALEILSQPRGSPAPQGYDAYLSAWSSKQTKSNQPPIMNIPSQEDPLLHYLASRIMQNGNRARASRTVSRTLLHIHAWTRQPPLPILRQAIFALAPAARVASQTHGAKVIQLPMPLSEKQGIFYAVKWLLEEVKGRNGGPKLEERLAREIILLIKGESKALEKKTAFHKLAMGNRGNLR